MAKQLHVRTSDPSISDVYQRITSGKLKLQPDFQRQFVWTHEHQEQFIDTILKGYPFPEIYVSQGDFDEKTLTTNEDVIDGQQRLTTIQNYIEENFSKPLKSIPYFKDLSSEEKKDFMQYPVIMRNIGDVEQDKVGEIFRRINLTKFKLEDIEIHNAVYDGEFISAAKSIASKADLQGFGVFRESDFTRMADIHYILLVMSTVEHGGYFTRDTEIESSIVNYNEDYENCNKITQSILSVFKIINDLKLAPDSIWFRKSNFFTMTIELLLAPEIPGNLKNKLDTLEEQIMQNKLKPKNEFGNYYSYMYQGTNSRKARVTRGNLFRKHILS